MISYCPLRLLVTGGSGFIGSAVIRTALASNDYEIINLDKLTYAANPDALAMVEKNPRYHFEHVDILDRVKVRHVLEKYRPEAIMHLAAESHVDRSIDAPKEFINTNVVGTFCLLEEASRYWNILNEEEKTYFRFHHVSTDEVFGSLGTTGAFNEKTAYAPNSPYSASKAASDHFVRAWYHTFGLPVVVSNCSNNYGLWQFPEKMIPLMIIKSLLGESLPVYGQGLNVRDWLHVEDHAVALLMILRSGRIGESYAVGGGTEQRNIDVVESICDMVDNADGPLPNGQSRRSLIRFVADRPGHDARYAIDSSKITSELGWRPIKSFASGLSNTVNWYLANRAWWEQILRTRYSGERLGTTAGWS